MMLNPSYKKCVKLVVTIPSCENMVLGLPRYITYISIYLYTQGGPLRFLYEVISPL